MIELRDLLDYTAWADGVAVDAIAALPDSSDERVQAVRVYAHLAAAAHVWHSRLEGRSPRHPVWPDLSLEDACALAADSLAGLRAWAERDAATLATTIEYRTGSGHTFRHTAADLITHVVLHGSYHRGQLALLVRQGGGTPVNSDYVLHVRGAQALATAPVPPGARG